MRSQRLLAVLLGLVIVQAVGLVGSQPAPGAEGPIGILSTETPAHLWVGSLSGQQTTQAIMSSPTMEASVPAAGAHREAIEPDRRQLPQRPGPAGASSPTPRPTKDATGLAQTVATPNVDVATLADTLTVPPDTMGDVGPAQYLVGVNGRIRTIDKVTGTADGVLDASMDTFFDTVRNGQLTTNPRVRYDRGTGRWFVTMVNIELPNRYLLAVSDSAVIAPGTTWSFFFWANARRAGGSPSGDLCVADYATLGVDEHALYVGANQYCGPTMDSVTYDSSSAYVVRKADLLAGTPALVLSAFDAVATLSTAGPYTPQGVDNFDAGTSEGYFIGVDSLALGRLQVRRITDPGGSPSISANLTIDVAATAFPLDIAHPGGLAPLDGLDDRLQQAVIRHGRLWTSHHIQVDASGAASTAGGRNGIRWYEIDNVATTPTVRQSGTVFDAASVDPASYFMGSLMVSGQGHVALGSSLAGAASHVNGVATGRLAGDPLGTMDDAPVLFTSNSSFTYNVEPPPDPQRWGAYSYTSLDPDDDMTMWTLQEYVNANDSYALRLVRLLAPPPAGVTSMSPATTTPDQTNLMVTVDGTAVGGSGFFDPGPGFPSRLTASFSGTNVVVSSVAVISPTQVGMRVETVGASAGAYTLTITNPDGQTSTLVDALVVEDNVAPVAAADAFATAFNVPLNVATPGVLANDSDANGDALTAVLQTGPAHGELFLNGNGSFTYTPAVNYSGPDAFTYQAYDGHLASAPATVSLTVRPNSPPAGNTDTYATPFGTVLNIAAPGVLANDTDADGDALSAVFVAGPTHGVLGLNADGSFSYTADAGYAGADAFSYQASDGLALSAITTVSVTVGQPANAQPPTGLLASSIVGGLVTLRWTPPQAGPTPTGYVLEGGLMPGEVLASIPTDSAFPIYTFTAPTGSFYVRLHTLAGADRSLASNELRIHVNVLVAPSAPASLVGLVNGTSVDLAWRNTFDGGSPTSILLDVTGSAVTTIPLAASDTFTFAGVPPGTYALRLRAVNAGGTSAQSNEVTVTFPEACSGAPGTPSSFLAYRLGNTIFVVWDPATSGPAATGYVLDVTGAFVGSFTTTSRTLSGSASPGSYSLSVRAINACGSSGVTAIQTIVVP
ncbi:MAG TPA: Ig-like domain-containing protein [Vicinamibacterales bacterium]|nr:Ig-like domain-containing protein [Vicinamibacterales bacterium]